MLIVPKFAMNAATTCRKALPRSCLLWNGFDVWVFVGFWGVWLTITGAGVLLSITNVWVSLKFQSQIYKLNSINQHSDYCIYCVIYIRIHTENGR